MSFIDQMMVFKRERVELPNGLVLYMRPLSGIEAETISEKGLANVVKVTIITATDEAGNQLFKPEDEAKLKALPYPILQKLIQVQNKLNEPEESSKN